MSFLLTFRMPQNDIIDQLPDVHQERFALWNLQYKYVGIINGNRKICNAIVNDTFVGTDDERVDEDGKLLKRSQLPPSWIALGQHDIQRGSDLLKSIPGTPVTIDAGTITDADLEHSQWYARYYVQSVVDDTDPDNPIITGVILLDRVGNPIVQDDTDPENPVYIIAGAAPANDGSYTKTWTTPGKDVPGVGIVDPSALEPNGDYIHTPYTVEVDKPALVEMTPVDPAYIDFMPDVVVYDEDGNEISRDRPTEAAEISLFGGYTRNL